MRSRPQYNSFGHGVSYSAHLLSFVLAERTPRRDRPPQAEGEDDEVAEPREEETEVSRHALARGRLRAGGDESTAARGEMNTAVAVTAAAHLSARISAISRRRIPSPPTVS